MPKLMQRHTSRALNRPIAELTADSLTQVAADQPIYIYVVVVVKAPRSRALDGLDDSREYICIDGRYTCGT